MLLSLSSKNQIPNELQKQLKGQMIFLIKETVFGLQFLEGLIPSGS